MMIFELLMKTIIQEKDIIESANSAEKRLRLNIGLIKIHGMVFLVSILVLYIKVINLPDQFRGIFSFLSDHILFYSFI